MVTGSSMLLFLFQWKNKNVDVFLLGLLNFGIQNKIPSDLLSPTILILPQTALGQGATVDLVNYYQA